MTTPAPAKTAQLRSGLEVIASLLREGWSEQYIVRVFRSRDGRWVKVVLPDGQTAEAALDQLEGGGKAQPIHGRKPELGSVTDPIFDKLSRKEP